MGDSVISTGINAVAPYGPPWVIGIFVIAAFVIIVAALIPTIKRAIESYMEIKEREQANVESREKRKREEMLERAERDGQMIQLVSETNRVVERNSQAFSQMTEKLSYMSDRDEHINESLSEVRESIKTLDSSVGEMRVEMAKMKRGM